MVNSETEAGLSGKRESFVTAGGVEVAVEARVMLQAGGSAEWLRNRAAVGRANRTHAQAWPWSATRSSRCSTSWSAWRRGWRWCATCRCASGACAPPRGAARPPAARRALLPAVAEVQAARGLSLRLRYSRAATPSRPRPRSPCSPRPLLARSRAPTPSLLRQRQRRHAPGRAGRDPGRHAGRAAAGEAAGGAELTSWLPRRGGRPEARARRGVCSAGRRHPNEPRTL